MKRLLTVFISISLVLTFIPTFCLPAFAEEKSGECGEIMTWELVDDGTLTISGDGAMYDYTIYDGKNPVPWYDLRDNIKRVVFVGNITTIGSYSFLGCTNLNTVELPRALQRIKSNAFRGCVSLQKVNLSNELSVIESNAFYGCSRLQNPELPESLTTIGAYAFGGCTFIKAIELPEKVTSIGAGAFSATSITSIIIPETIKEIPQDLCRDCKSLETVVLSSSVTSIKDGAFYSCEALNSINLKEGIKTIGNEAFYYCKSLESVDLPDSLTSIGFSAFYRTKLTAITIPKKITTILSGTFQMCISLKSVNFPDGLISIGKNAFSECKKLKKIKLPNNVESIGEKAFWHCISLNEVDFGHRIAYIGPYAFEQCGVIETISLPMDISSINDNTFGYCSSLKQVEIPEGVKSIGKSAFYMCESLTDVEIPSTSSIDHIGASAFAGCSSLEDFSIPFHVTLIDSYTFANCTSIKEVEIPNSVTAINENAFKNCSGLEDVYYFGTKEQWESDLLPNIDNEYKGNDPLLNATIHFMGIGPLNVPEGQFCLHIVDENGKTLKGATTVKVRWERENITSIVKADAQGNAFVDIDSAAEDPVLIVEKKDYLTWTNENTNWTIPEDRYETITMYPEDYGELKLKSAVFAADALLNRKTNLLAETKKITLDSDELLDLAKKKFSISCTAYNNDVVKEFKLYQKGKTIKTSQDGVFSDLSVKDFYPGEKCFVRVVANDGREVDTVINLEFVENKITEKTTFSLSSTKITISPSDETPLFGGKEYSFDLPISSPIIIEASEDKMKIGINLNLKGGKSREEQIEKAQKLYNKVSKVGSVYSSGLKTGRLSAQDQKTFDSLVADENQGSFFKRIKIKAIGYGEYDWGSSVANLGILIQIKAQLLDLDYDTVVYVPLTLQIGVDVDADFDGKVSYDFVRKLASGSLEADIKPSVDIFGGVGTSDFVGAGLYGNAELDVGVHFIKPPVEVQKVDLTGEVGIRAYFVDYEKEKSFGNNTWHLYNPAEVKSAALMNSKENSEPWYSGIYDASDYVPENLSYLRKESDWQGSGKAVLMESSAHTQFSSLLTDTYRNAQPIMVSDGTAIYAAFIRADEDTGHHYVAVTKFDGNKWTEPTRIDKDSLMDDRPTLFVSGDNVFLTYFKATKEKGDSILTYAQNQELVVGILDKDTLKLKETQTFQGDGFLSMSDMTSVDGNVSLVWVDAPITDENSILQPVSGTIYYAEYDNHKWSEKAVLAESNVGIYSIAAGEKNGKLAAGLFTGDSMNLAADGKVDVLADGAIGKISYGIWPGTTQAVFMWNANGMLNSSEGQSVEVEGITSEYQVLGNNIYYSTPTDGSANLAVMQFHNETGWGLPIQLTGDSRYLENLSVANLDGVDYVLGLHTNPTITETSVDDPKNLVWSAVMPVSDIRLDDIDYDASTLTPGEDIQLQVTAINAGDHIVNSMDFTINDSIVKTEKMSLAPGDMITVEVPLTCPTQSTEFTFGVIESGEDDYTPNDNIQTIKLGLADLEVNLDYQQIGAFCAVKAIVTNKGISNASGKLTIYDADSKAVVDYDFSDLAPGETLVETYEINPSFAGFYGGDISASVTTSQEEEDVLNNSANLFIPERTTSIQVENVTAQSNQVNAVIINGLEENVELFCAAYDSNGKQLEIRKMRLDAGATNTCHFDFTSESIKEMRLFMLKDDSKPATIMHKELIAA